MTHTDPAVTVPAAPDTVRWLETPEQLDHWLGCLDPDGFPPSTRFQAWCS